RCLLAVCFFELAYFSSPTPCNCHCATRMTGFQAKSLKLRRRFFIFQEGEAVYEYTRIAKHSVGKTAEQDRK
ncbi:MAG: hypothetical protein VX078_18880, partial [Pseudomonadota bacterium]|nr:hypothetical protein [Pseudomonadota bacterium]